MTSCAMTAGMVPLALGWGEGGEQSAPLGRAVIGGLVAATLATLLVLPAAFAVVWGRNKPAPVTLYPFDPESRYYRPLPEAACVPAPGANGHSNEAILPSPSGVGTEPC